MQKLFDKFADWFIRQDFVIQVMISPAFVTVTFLVALAPWVILIESIRFVLFMLFNYE